MVRRIPLLAAFLLAAATVNATDPPLSYRARLALAFVLGEKVPEPPAATGPEDAENAKKLAELAARVKDIQAGTDGTPQALTGLLAEIDGVAKVLGPGKPLMPPERVIKDYMSRRKGGLPPLKLIGKGEPDAAAVQAHLDASRRGAAVIAAELLSARARAPLTPQDLLKSSLPPLKSERPVAEMRAPDSNIRPIWNPGGNGSFLGNVSDYVHAWMSNKRAADGERLARIEHERTGICAPGWTSDCVWSTAQLVSGHIVTGLQQQGADVTSPDIATRQTGVMRFTPFAVIESGPQWTAAARNVNSRDPFLTSGILALASAAVVLDATSWGTFGLMRRAATKSVEKVLIDDAFRDAAAGAEARTLASKERAPGAFVPDVYGDLLKGLDQPTLALIGELEAKGVPKTSIRDALARSEKQCVTR